MKSPTARTALVCGISGQDGSYLARSLLEKGYRVIGTSRSGKSGDGLARLGISERVEMTALTMQDGLQVSRVLEQYRPREIYNLAGQSSVALSFEQPLETMEGIAIGALNVLEAIRRIDPEIRLFSAGSGECFGDTGATPANEGTAFRPGSPYAIAKAASFWELANYRERHGLFACTGILFNHESPLRPERFVTRKIVSAACRIAAGSRETLHLGNLDIIRDWGWAPEFVEAMQLMLRLERPQDVVIATGESHPLSAFVAEVFASVGLRWQDHVKFDPGLLRPTDPLISRADASLAESLLGWRAKTRMADVARQMVGSVQESK